MLEIDFEDFQEKFKIALVSDGHVRNNSLVFEDKNGNKIILLKVVNKDKNCCSCLPVKRKELSVGSLVTLEQKCGLKIIK